MKRYPGIKVTEVVKQIAKLWQALSKEEKNAYKEAAKNGIIIGISYTGIDKERYEREVQNLTMSDQKVSRPKKPMTPYMIFVREVRIKFRRDHNFFIDKTKSC